MKTFRIQIANNGKHSVMTLRRDYLTSDELNKVASVDVCNFPKLQKYQTLFLEQVFSSGHDKDMVPRSEISTYRRSIGELMIRAGIASNLRQIATILADLGFRTSKHVIGEFRFVDSELPNAM